MRCFGGLISGACAALVRAELSQPGPSTESAQATGRDLFGTRGQFLVILAIYFGLQLVVRTLTSTSVDLDESEQVLFAQRFSWGYGPDPPLYTWLQIGFFSLFGQGVFALALLKNLLLFGTYALTYHNAQFITGRHDCGLLAAVSLLLLPTIVWESQRDLTHTVLATTMAAATLACFLQFQQSRRNRWYVLFGLAAGVGLLAKFSFVLWVLGLLGAAMFEARLRRTVLDWRMALALALSALMILPCGLWAVEHRDLAFRNATKLATGEQSWLRTIVSGGRNLLLAVGSVLGPLALVYAAVFARSCPHERLNERSALYGTLVIRAVLLILGALLVLILTFRATGFRERWFQTLLAGSPVAVVALLSNRLDSGRVKVFAWLGLTLMVVVLCMVPGRILFGEPLGREEPLMRPYAEVGAQIRAAIPPDAAVITDTLLTAGNIRLALPRNDVLIPELVGVFRPQTSQWALVWDARQSSDIPVKLRSWAEKAWPGALGKGSPLFFTAGYYYHNAKQFRMGTLVLK